MVKLTLTLPNPYLGSFGDYYGSFSKFNKCKGVNKIEISRFAHNIWKCRQPLNDQNEIFAYSYLPYLVKTTARIHPCL